MELHRIGVKFFAADLASVPLQNFIPVFHGWIQRQSLAAHLLIDIHDYSHLPNGPGILLVAHEGNFSIDMSDGRPGLLYYRKTPTAFAATEHVAAILKSALQACRLLEKDARLHFNLNDFVFIANDRLNAPNAEQTFQELQPALSTALDRVFEGAKFHLARTSLDPKERLTVSCKRKA
jgi:hypothetical protein